MTLEELKKEAEKHGYSLVKFPEKLKLLPCTCGGKRRSTYYIPGGMFLACEKCGKQAPSGKTEKEARVNWNKMIESQE